MTAPAVEPIDAMHRREFVRLSAGSLATLAAGCRSPRDRALARGNTVIVAVPGTETQVLSPTPTWTQPFWLVFLPLMAPNDRGEMRGRLAERWEHSPDYVEWTYYLRPGVRWHDGHPVTAHDVKFSLELMNGSDVLELTGIESVTVLNDLTVRVRKPHYGGSGSTYQWGEIQYPKHLLEHLDTTQFWEWEFWKHPVGNGPYRFVRYESQTMMEFEANPDFYRGKPPIERVVAKFAGAVGFTDLQAGNLDALAAVNTAWVPNLMVDARFHLYHAYSTGHAALYWQHQDPLFANAQVRRALTLSINRPELLALLYLPEDAPLTDGPLSERQLRRGELDTPLPYDPVQARQLLEEAGWSDRTGEGIREREGLAFRFTALVPSRLQKIAVYVQAQLRRVGVDMVVQMQQDSNKRIRSGEFQAAFDGINPGGLFKAMGSLHTNVAHPVNGLGYHNARVVELANRVLLSADPDVEDQAFTELRDIFRDDVPVTYLVPYVAFSVAHRRLRGLSSPWRIDPLAFMDDLWLDNRSRP